MPSKPLPFVPAYGLALVLGEVENAIKDGHTPDAIARHLYAIGLPALAGRDGQRLNLVCVLKSWAHLIESDLDVEARMLEAERRRRPAVRTGA